MISKASVAKHPIHPMLVPLPIGLWIFSLVCDLIYKTNGDLLWNTMAHYSLAGGIIGGLFAALPGLIDFLALPPSSAKRIGLWHLGLNLWLPRTKARQERNILPDPLKPRVSTLRADQSRSP